MLGAFVERARQGDEEAFGALARVVGDRCIVQGSLTGRDDQSDLFIISAVDSTYARLTEEPGGYRERVAWVPGAVAAPSSPNP